VKLYQSKVSIKRNKDRLTKLKKDFKMMKKLLLITLVPMTLSLQGAFVMKKGKPLEKIEAPIEAPATVVTQPIQNTGISQTDMNTYVETTQSDTGTNLGKKIFEIDFNKHSVGKYTKPMHKKDFYTYNGENLMYKNSDGTWMYGSSGPGETLTIVNDGGEKVLRVLYKKGRIGLGTYPQTDTYTGFQSLAALPKKNRPKEDIYNPQEVTLVYYVKFENDFDWAIGGKLPGLAGGVAPAGGQILGSHKLNNGFSARFMWHMLGEKYNKKPGIIGYIYDPGRSGTKGSKIYGAGPYLSTKKVPKSFFTRDYNSALELKKNRWYKIRQTIKPNTPGKNNAWVKVWIDDKLAADFGGIKLIADGMHGKYSVDRFLFSTFYGGGSQDYAPSRDTHARFKGIKIYVKQP
jgi:hypothetical protein